MSNTLTDSEQLPHGVSVQGWMPKTPSLYLSPGGGEIVDSRVRGNDGGLCVERSH